GVPWPVPPLTRPGPRALPPLAQLATYEAVRLFIDRATAAAPGFTMTDSNAAAVAQVCARLDGLPLAVELAAARVKALSVGQIAARLDDCLAVLTAGNRTAEARQHTLRGTFDWSYDLLSPPERALLRRLSVFAGGSAPGGAEAVCAGDGLDAAAVLELLSHLVEKSLVVVEEREGQSWYRFLEPTRQYAAEQLLSADAPAGAEMAATRRRHARFFLALAEATA